MHTSEVFYGMENCNLYPICISLHTKPLIDLFKEKKFLLKSKTYTRTSVSLMMAPHLNSVVFYYKTTTWSRLSRTVCSQMCSKTCSCFGACYRSSFPENLAK